MYEIVFTPQARKLFLQLQKEIQIRILKKLERVRIRPEHFLLPLSNIGGFKLRVGSYRLIIDLEKDRLILLIIKVGHRKNIYKGLN
jgi:mRNA interferase RelE/StbE